MLGNRKFRTGMVVGVATSSQWAQAVIKPTANGLVILALKLSYQGDGDLIQLPQVGGEILDLAKNKLAGLTKCEEIEEELRKTREELPEGIEVSQAAVVFAGESVMIAGSGEMEVYIARNGKLGKIFLGNGTLTGKLEENDIYALTSREVVAKVGENKWKEHLSKGVLGLEELAVEIHSQGNSEGMVSVFAALEQEEEQVKGGTYAQGFGQLLRKLREKPLEIRHEQLKTNAWIGAALVGLLVIGVLIGVVKRTQIMKSTGFNNLKSQTEQKLAEARSVGDLNPERAKSLIASAKTEISSYQENTKDEKYRNMAAELATSIATAETEIFRKEEVAMNTLIETEVLEKGFVPELMSLDESGSVILAEKGARVWGMSIKDKSSWEVELKGVSQVRDISTAKNKIFVLNETGVFVYDSKTEEAQKRIEPDDMWKDPTYIESYSGNVYVLDRSQGEIWKYPVLTDSYGARRRWLAPGIVLDFTYVTDMAIDGDIWIITSSGKLEQYRMGVPQNFAMEGFPYLDKGKLANPTALYVSDKKVYVVESGARRVVVIDKESGKYESQYVNEEIASAKAVGVSEGKCYLLVDKKIIWFEL